MNCKSVKYQCAICLYTRRLTSAKTSSREAAEFTTDQCTTPLLNMRCLLRISTVASEASSTRESILCSSKGTSAVSHNPKNYIHTLLQLTMFTDALARWAIFLERRLKQESFLASQPVIAHDYSDDTVHAARMEGDARLSSSANAVAFFAVCKGLEFFKIQYLDFRDRI